VVHIDMKLTQLKRVKSGLKRMRYGFYMFLELIFIL
jgi:hypothetical protein